jgi:cell division septum initiation protein DivIVA
MPNMSQNFKKSFSNAINGYSRSDVDEYVAGLLQALSELENYNALVLREQNTLRERVTELEESLKAAKSPGYAQVGAQFEQTLRLAESEAARLINEASREAIRQKDVAKAEVEAMRQEAQEKIRQIEEKAARDSQKILAEAKKAADAISETAQAELNEALKKRTDLEKEANVVRSEADTYAADVKAELQADVEKIQNANARLLKRNADLEAEIAKKLDEGEKQALEIFRRVEKEAEATRAEAQRELNAATAEAASLLENADEALRNARVQADRLVEEANAVALNLLADTRTRAEKLATRSLDLTRSTIIEAQYLLSKMPSQKSALEQFLVDTSSLLTPEQQVMLSRRESIEKGQAPALEAELVEDAPGAPESN